MGQVIDFEAMKNFKFRRKRGRRASIPDDMIIHITLSTEENDIRGGIVYYVGPEAFMNTEQGKKAALERLFQMIAHICEDDPSIGVECYELLSGLLYEGTDRGPYA